jgi:signal transduction histidine kinase
VLLHALPYALRKGFRELFQSIRGPLVLSYMLLALLAVGLVGALGLFLIRWEVTEQEDERLTANAEAVAREAAPLVWPVVQSGRLSELARTSSFLGDVRVRILDSRHRVLADSRPHAEGEDFVWILPSLEAGFSHWQGSMWPLMVVQPTGDKVVIPSLASGAPEGLEWFPPDTSYTLVRRYDDAWGSRFMFGVVQPMEEGSSALGGSGIEADALRSGQVTTVPIGDGSRLLGFVELSDARDRGSQALETSRRAFLLAAVGAMIMAVAVGLVVGGGLSAPLRELAHVAGRMSDSDLSVRAPVRGKDEIAQLAGQFNQMAERLDASFAELASERDALRRFIADASHGLRTPITALRSFNELMQGTAAGDAAARAEFLEESRVQLDRLEWITRNLLDLSRLDAGLVTLQTSEQDVGELIDSAIAPFGALAQDRGVSLSACRPQRSFELECDRPRIELALANLVHNAIKFTPEGGRVEVGAVEQEMVARLWVRDTGVGIDPQDQPYIFDRFYRGRARRTEGSGLGLAIARSVVEAHGGRITVSSRRDAGSHFTIEIPLKRDSNRGDASARSSE